MDAILLTQTLATIVGLISDFKQERGSDEALDHRKFIEWLQYHKHEEIKNLIINTHNLPREIDELLRKDVQEIVLRLRQLDGAFASIAARLEIFSGVVNALVPGRELSEQARKLLVEFAKSGKDFILLVDIPMGGGHFVVFVPGSGQDADEPRFVKEDLTTLSAYGLLAIEYNSSGEPIFRLTRNGDRVAKLLEGSGSKSQTP